jgi:hypothetical protein
MSVDQLNGPAKFTLDLISLGAVVGALAKALPPIAALLGILWYCVLLYDRFLGKGRKP